jgi:hypothetical protein
MTEHLAEMRALLTRAAIVESQRQAARDRREWHAETQAERELRELWKRHAELEAAERIA